ncbi:MAG: TetR/AcrR family transcriptional regulator [Porticoccaceae bacterium]
MKPLSHAERTEISELRMLREATKLILDVGTSKTTLKDVSIGAGYSHGLASQRYGSKEGLFLALEEFHRKLWKEELDKYAAGQTGLQGLLARIHAMEKTLEKEPDNVRAMYLLWFDSIGEYSELNKKLKRFNAGAKAAVALYVKEGKKKGEIASSIKERDYAFKHVSEMFGMLYLWAASPDSVDICNAFKKFRQRTESELRIK